MSVALSYIRKNPGCCIADVDRACRTSRGGHRFMYESVHRLERSGFIRIVRSGARSNLYVTSARNWAVVQCGIIGTERYETLEAAQTEADERNAEADEETGDDVIGDGAASVVEVDSE